MDQANLQSHVAATTISLNAPPQIHPITIDLIRPSWTFAAGFDSLPGCFPPPAEQGFKDDSPSSRLHLTGILLLLHVQPASGLLSFHQIDLPEDVHACHARGMRGAGPRYRKLSRRLSKKLRKMRAHCTASTLLAVILIESHEEHAYNRSAQQARSYESYCWWTIYPVRIPFWAGVWRLCCSNYTGVSRGRSIHAIRRANHWLTVSTLRQNAYQVQFQPQSRHAEAWALQKCTHRMIASGIQ